MGRVAVPGALRGAHALLGSHLAVRVARAIHAETAARWVQGVVAAKKEWTRDFGGEQFCLGRAFYTHLETDKTQLYFEDARASDALVERYAPGLQATLRALFAEAVSPPGGGASRPPGGGASRRVVRRPDWCGAGVHVFPADGPVAARGGAVHFDTEGLAEAHIGRRARALSLVAMLQPPTSGGGLRVWPVLFEGSHAVDPATLSAGGDASVESDAGDIVLFDSYRLHQIQPFGGRRDRISATLHGAEIAPDLWETWF
jgi:hypothetical protein